MIVERDTEYAVEVVGRGFIADFNHTVKPEVPKGMNQAEAFEEARVVRERYTRMGCPDVADTVQVVQRTVTIERSDWTPIGES